MPELGSDSVAGFSELIVVPERTMAGDVLVRYQFFTDGDGDLQLQLEWYDLESKSTSESIVESIAGESVEDVILQLAQLPDIGNDYQPLGVRVNKLVSNGFNTIRGPLGWGRSVPWLFMLSDVSNPTLLADSLQVTYVGGERETYYTALGCLPVDAYLKVNETGEVNFDRDGAVASLNQPGAAFDIFQTAIGDIVNASLPRRLSRDEPEHSRKLVESTANTNDFAFDWVSADNMTAYAVFDDYAVLKIQDFLIEVADARGLWINLAAAAKEKGVTKLMIDISSNGGGFGQSALSLIVAMFPSLDFSFFQNLADMTYNEPMRVWEGAVQPVIDRLQLSPTVLDEVVASVTEDDFVTMNATMEAMLLMCESGCARVKACEEKDEAARCGYLRQLQLSVNGFLEQPNATLLETLALDLATVLNLVGPFNVVSSPGGGNVRTVNRGGVETRLTSLFTYYNENQYEAALNASIEANHSFAEYLFVSDGVSGSATAVFQAMATQLWRNREKSLVTSRVTNVGYGGTKASSDLTMASFPATVESGHLEYPLIGDGALFMLETLFPPGSENYEAVTSARYLYELVLPVPPYFANTLPRLPVWNQYDPFMQPGALPLQYVKMPIDVHIPRIYPAVYLGVTTADLADLCAKASNYFESPTSEPTSTPVADTLDAPVSAPTIDTGADPSSSGHLDSTSMAVVVVVFISLLSSVPLNVLVTKVLGAASARPLEWSSWVQ